MANNSGVAFSLLFGLYIYQALVKKPCNIANLSECGSYPLSIEVLIKTCKYLKRLLTTDSKLLLCAYKEGSTSACGDK